jgi:hypothetical protein
VKKHKVWRFNCDFCGKGYFKEQKCLAHERGCVRNPGRICGFCERHSLVQENMGKLLRVLDDHGLDIDLLREAAHGCPMCMLSSVMFVNKTEGWKRNSEECWHFDYPAELKRFDDKGEEVFEGI